MPPARIKQAVKRALQTFFTAYGMPEEELAQLAQAAEPAGTA